MRRVRGLGVVGLLALAVVVAGASSASAAPLANLGSFGVPNGPGAGQLVFARGLAANHSGNGAAAGSVYVAEANANHRISQYTGDGEFVRMWGWDVVSSGPGNDLDGTPNEFEICVPANGDVCKAGVAGAGAGQLANPSAIAVDQSNGYLYVTSQTNRRVDVFSGTGQFAGAFGWGVDTGATAPEICTAASSCQVAGAAGGDAGRFGALAPVSAPAVDPSVPGRVYVPDAGNLRVAQYETTIAGGVLTAASFSKAFGWDVDPAGGTELESCVASCKSGIGGAGDGQFSTGAPTGVAVDGDGAIYALSAPATCSAASPCRVQKFAPDASSAATFGPDSGDGQIVFTSGASTSAAALALAVDPVDDDVFVLRRDSTTSYRVFEYDSGGAHLDIHPAGAALAAPPANTGPGLAIGTDDRVYANLGSAASSVVQVLGPVPDPTPVIGAVTGVGPTTVEFAGTVEIPAPGAPTFATTYRFEYSSNGIDWSSTQVQPVADGATGIHAVTATVSGLNPNTLYQVRLSASTGGSEISSATLPFTTDTASPRVAMTFVDEVTQTAARLGAHVDPEGLASTYHFEWGGQPCSDVPNPCAEMPAFERHLGDGNKALIANESIDGLSGASTYHYRVVATNAEGTTYGPDQTFETLNECNLPDGRCYELASPADKGPLGAAGDLVATGDNLRFQASRDGSAVGYMLAYGMPDGTAGNEVVHMSRRDGDGWTTTQVDAPALTVGDGDAVGGIPSRTLALSENMTCGVLISGQPLGADPPLEVLEGGNSVLYRSDLIGGWTTLTKSAPANYVEQLLGPRTAQVAGIGPSVAGGECGRIVFRTEYEYADEAPQTQAVDAIDGSSWLYRWDGDALEYVGMVPGPSGPKAVQAIPGASQTRTNDNVGLTSQVMANVSKAVSDDAQRVFFTAVSQTGDNAGQQSVFRRELGSPVAVDAGLSQTTSLPGGTPNTDDVLYQTASEDGSEVFFIGRYGLASNEDGTAVQSSSGPSACDDLEGAGCDLYRYSFETGKLTDLSANDDPANANGASVVGVLGASDDGDYVYFAARGQLDPGEGRTAAQNVANDTYSVYVAHDGQVRYVGRADELDAGAGDHVKASLSKLLVKGWGEGFTASRVTPDGRRIVYQTAQTVTGYDSGGVSEAYLYDFDADETVCVSCRRDGGPSIPNSLAADALISVPLPNGTGAMNALHPPVTLTPDGRRVFFYSFARLATGATQGRRNLYQWEEGQIAFLASSSPAVTSLSLNFAGASQSGDEVFFATVDRYTWEDVDSKLDVYAAKVGGGFEQPAPDPDPCDPVAEGACAGGGAGGLGLDVRSGGPADATEQKARATLTVRALSRGQLARLAGGRRVGLAVRVSRPGRVSVAGVASVGGLRARVISASRTAAGAGVVRVPVTLSRAARARLARSGRLKVRLVARLDGASRRVVSILTFKARKAKRKAGSRRPDDRGSSRVRRANDDRRTGR